MRSTSNGNAIPQLGVTAKSDRTVLLVGASVATLLVGLTLTAHARIGLMGPEIKPFMPISATIWAFAELLTAFLLLSQFYVGGKLSFAIIAAGYAITGLTTIPYLVFFPNVFTSGPYLVGDVQVSAWLWVTWHLVFPISIAAAHIIDGSLDSTTVPKNAIPSTVAATVGSSVAVTTLLAVVAYFARNFLPRIIEVNGHFTPLYRAHVIPVVVVVNALAVLIVLFRARRLSQMQMWLAIALLTMAMDGLTNVWATGRFSVVWYAGKFEALFTAIIVLGMLLLEVATLYRRLYDVASIDTLTGLPNRRSFNDSLGKTLEGRDQRSTGVALLVLDVDKFKNYNDRYGHAAGDTALATVARALETSLVRSNDFVARFGGEEFVILLPDVMVDEVEKIADRVRMQVSKLAIIHEDSPSAHLTVSVGAAFCSRHQEISGAALFDHADRALYAAKEKGRNCVVVKHVGTAERVRSAPVLVVNS